MILFRACALCKKNMYDVIEEGFNLYANITTTRSDSSRQYSGYFFLQVDMTGETENIGMGAVTRMQE